MSIVKVRPCILAMTAATYQLYLERYLDHLEDEQIDRMVEVAMSFMADWPESKVITCLLRDMAPEEFYNA